MFVLVRMQLCNHADTQPVKRFKRQNGYAMQQYISGVPKLGYI